MGCKPSLCSNVLSNEHPENIKSAKIREECYTEPFYCRYPWDRDSIYILSTSCLICSWDPIDSVLIGQGALMSDTLNWDWDSILFTSCLVRSWDVP